MKNLILAALATFALTSSAGASGLTLALSNLTFPPTDTVTVSKDCVSTATPTTVCVPQR